MERIDDEAKWQEAFLDTPLGLPENRVDQAHAAGDPNLLLDVPGTCLKSREKDGPWPKHCGVLVRYSENEVVVRGHGSIVSPKCLWVGTADEYRRMWEVD